jgi:hypothetical protein
VDRFQHLQNLLDRYQAQIQGLENAIVLAAAADRTRLKQQLQDLKAELRHYEAEYERLSPGNDRPRAATSPAPSAPTPLVEPPTGSLPLESRFYVVREADRQALRLIRSQGITLSITGSRQVGKSSLLARVCEAAGAVGKRVAFLDLQSWEQEALQDPAIFYPRFCLQLTLELGLPNRVADHWDVYGSAGASYCCSAYVQDHLLGVLAQPLVIALDEVEMLIDSPFRSAFFGMLRSWHNARATKPAFKPLDLVLVSSTEPYQLIEDLNQSPFNVGENLKLQDFSEFEASLLNQSYGNPLTSQDLQHLWQLVQGHPYLTAQALYQVASQQTPIATLLQTASQDQGMFGGHLQYHRLRLEKRPGLLVGMEQIARGNGQQVAKEVAMRLEAAGLVRWEANQAVPRCELYRRYFHPSSPTVFLPEPQPPSPNQDSRGRNPWISGSFYLAVAMVMMIVVAVIGKIVPIYVLAIVVIAGLLMVILVGGFQLRQDDRFSEANFLTLMQETLKRLPLIRQDFTQKSGRE